MYQKCRTSEMATVLVTFIYFNGIYSKNRLELRNMFLRYVKLTKLHSFFLFGLRGSGKSTLIRKQFKSAKSLYIDLLESQTESRYAKNPDLLISDIKAKAKIDWVIIDEIQKLPKLLDLVHKAIEELGVKFILTGSSARKLKRGGANLLAGRAFLNYLFPLTHQELADEFDLNSALAWGTLPKIFQFKESDDRIQFLHSYVQTYLKEEILIEQVVRNIQGFKNFLEVAAQMNGKTLNFAKIGRAAGVDSKTVQSFFQILEDTLLGFWLPAYHKSVRKSQKMQPKFYWADLGILRAIEGTLESKPVAGTSTYGQYFESFVVNEIFRANSYSQKNMKISHYQTSTGQEIDLVLSKANKIILVEIKSNTSVDAVEVAHLKRIASGFKNAEIYYISRDSQSSLIEGVRCLSWQNFIKEIF